jgi:hypothetical protein
MKFIKKIASALAQIGRVFSKTKKFNKEIVSYEKICTFGINPDALL